MALDLQNLSKFQLQLLGICDITPDFVEEFEEVFGIPYFSKK